jgi:integrase
MSTKTGLIQSLREGQSLDVVRARLAKSAHEKLKNAKAPLTHKAYAGDWRRFREWCDALGEESMPAKPGTISVYLSDMADRGLKTSTIQRALAAITYSHRLAKASPLPTQDETVVSMMAAIRRSQGTRSEGKDPIMLDDLRAMVRGWDYNRALHLRNRCILTFVWWTAVRRSEAAAVDLEHLEWVTRDQVRFLIPFSKTDQTGEGQVIGIERVADKEVCPLHNLEQWTARAGITSGPLFLSLGGPKATGGRLSESSIYNVVKKSAKRADVDFDPDAFGAHSLRAGFVTQAYASGMREFDIRQVTRHKTEDMTRRYIRPASVFEHGAAKKIV